MRFTIISLLFPSASALALLGGARNTVGVPSFCDKMFNVVEHPSERGAIVLEAPVRQDGVKLYIAIDSDSFQAQERPGNGGIRLLHYDSSQDAIDDAVRLAKGMTRKHDMFRTGFSGAKVVVAVDLNLNSDSSSDYHAGDHDNLCGIENIEREALMQDAGRALEALGGQMYTGCDLNTSDEDMNYLVNATNDKFVLAGRNSQVDTNVATASSVIGSILGALDSMNNYGDDHTDLSKLTFTVQGCGKVGSSVAKQLVTLGAKCVQTCDLYFPEKAASIQGCTPIQDWANTPCDVLIPCANSLAITEEVARDFPEGIKYCVGAANSPFANEKARSIFDKRGIMHVPESISSAGGILADSVEWYDTKMYQTVVPALMYGWIRDQSRGKASDLVLKAGKESKSINSVLRDVLPSRSGDPVGKNFPEWIRENTINTDTLIVGGGLAGTASAFSLGQRGVKTVLVEQGDSIAHPQASSNGDSRMYRKMYSSEFFSKMQSKALDRWSEVEEITGENLLRENGLLFYGEDTGETVEGSVLGAKHVMEKLHLPHKFYASGDDIAAKYPALAGCKGKDYSGVYEDTAGYIRATRACKAMVEAAGEYCDLQVNSKIVSLDVNSHSKDGDIMIKAVKEDGTTLTAKHAVLACGPWTNKVLEMANLPKLKLDIWMVQWAHYEVDADIGASIPQAFHFRKESGIDGGLYYVFPASATECLESEKGKTYVKVGVDFPTNEALDSMENFNYQGSEEVLSLIDAWVSEHLPQVGKRTDSYTSPYTMTDDSFFVMDKIQSNVALFAGGSGRAFKFGPLIGDCMASLLHDEEGPVDLKPFSLNREAMKL